jgi:hypothetical protein
MMTGQESFEIWLGIVTIVCIIFFSIVLGNSLGAIGIAIATTAAVALKNTASYLRIYSTLKKIKLTKPQIIE